MSVIKIDRCDLAVDGAKETLLVIRAADEIAGTCRLQFEGRTSAGLAALFVVPGARKCGFGSALVREAVRIAKTAGCVNIALSLHRNNRRLFRAFYEKLGFTMAVAYPDGEWMLTRNLNPVPDAVLKP